MIFVNPLPVGLNMGKGIFQKKSVEFASPVFSDLQYAIFDDGKLGEFAPLGFEFVWYREFIVAILVFGYLNLFEVLVDLVGVAVALNPSFGFTVAIGVASSARFFGSVLG